MEAIETPPDDGMTIEGGEPDEKAANAEDLGALPPSKLSEDRQFQILSGWWKSDADFSREWRAQARQWFDFRAGEQWTAEDKALLDDQERPHIVFNRVLTILKAVAGMEINGRHEIHFIPRNAEDTAVNEVLSAASKWMADSCDGEDEESTAFDHCCTTGMGWCLSDDAMVRLPNTHFATTRLYSGSVIEIDLENGKKLTGTPNHPVLTDMGWKRLHELCEGDNLVTSNFLERVQGLPVEQFDKVETRLKDKIDAFRAGRESMRFSTAPNDFYADGAGSKVHVVYADSLLLDKIRQHPSAHKTDESGLTWRNFLPKWCRSLLPKGLFDGSLYPAICQAAFDCIHAPLAKLTGNYVIAESMTGITQSSADAFRSHPVTIANFGGGQVVLEIEPDKFFSGNSGLFATSSPRLHGVAAAFEPRANGGHRYSNLIADFFDWKPRLEIEARKLFRRNIGPSKFVTRVKRRIVRPVKDFAVHDVGTSLGFFIAGDVVTSNTENRMSYKADPTGLYIEECINPLEMYWQRGIRKKNLVGPEGGARRISRVRQMPLGDAMRLFPGFTRDDLDAVWAVDGPMDYPQKTLEQRYKRDTDNVLNQPYDDLCEVTIVQMQWIEEEVYWLVADPETNTKNELSDKEYKVFEPRMKKLAALASQAGADPSRFEVHSARMTRDVFKQAFLGGDGVMLRKAGPSPIAGQFSWQCITGELDFVKGTWFGLVKVMRDPQMWANKWLSQILHILNTTAKGGIIAETDAFDDQREAEEGYALADSITWAATGALSGPNPKIIPKPGAGVADGYLGLMTFAISSIKDVTGINLELLGQQDQNQPGIIEAMRKQAGMTVLATLFDSLRRFRKNTGRSRLYFIQNFLSDGRLVRVVGPDGAQAVQLAKEKTTGEYDVIVDDTPTSPNQKEANWAIIQPLLGVFKEQLMANPQVFAMLLEYSPLPSRVVEAVKGFIKQGQNDPKVQQQKQEDRQLLVNAQVAAISKDQSIAELNNKKAGATEATAMYDIAMAKNMLAKNDTAGLQAHLDMMEQAAKARKIEIDGQTAAADVAHTAAKTQREVVGTHLDVAAAKTAAVDAGTKRITALHGAHSDHVGGLIDHLSATAGAHRDLAAAHKDRVIAAHTAATPIPQPEAGA